MDFSSILSQIKEPDVALTDYALFIECMVICFFVWKSGRFAQKEECIKLARLFGAFFFFIGMASFLGGTFHGFCTNGSLFANIVWDSTLVCIGMASLVLWPLSAMIGFWEKAYDWFLAFGIIQYLAYFLVLFYYTKAFWLAIACYAPAALFLLGIYIYRFMKRRETILIWGIVAICLILASSTMQMMRIGLHPVYFNHNALYHLFQFFALLFLSKSAFCLIKA